jgi:hypothetical protein
MPPKAPAHLQFEQSFWGDCCNTFDEQQKHYVYARLMGLPVAGYSLDVGTPRVLDIGGGPCSMLLLCNKYMSDSWVVDPVPYPTWTRQRYSQKGIQVLRKSGEDLTPEYFQCAWNPPFDEAWIYNCLQHCRDPQAIIRNALSCARRLRLFEWVDIPPHEGHPHELTAEKLDRWTGERGHVVELAESGCYGRGYSVVVSQAVPALP